MPIGEERNTVSRTAVMLLRKAASRGILSILFDYPGMGESAGTASEFSLHKASETGKAVLEKVCPEYSSLDIILLGIRSGAFTASDLQRYLQGYLLLWQPFMSGGEFLKEIRYKERIRGAITGSRDKHAYRINGEETEPGFSEELLSRKNILDGLDPSNVHVVQIAPVEKVLPKYRRISRRIPFSRVSCPPFWNPHENWDTSACADHTVCLLEQGE